MCTMPFVKYYRAVISLYTRKATCTRCTTKRVDGGEFVSMGLIGEE